MKLKKAKKIIKEHLSDEYSPEEIKDQIKRSTSIKVITLIEVIYGNDVTEHIRVKTKKLR